MMNVLGLTGGIATGKSTASRLFQELDSDCVVFDADRCVAELYANREVLDRLSGLLGVELCLSDGSLNRERLRALLFGDERVKLKVQGLIHPLVRKECLARKEKALTVGTTTSFIADVPLLFEGGFDFGQEANLVVAVSRETQVQRLIMRNGFDEATVQAILEAQLPIETKQDRADFVFWNEGSESLLQSQIKRFIENNYQ
ncbi:dephospho-CoA kinase [Rubritalea marina]|uniref:dephospho-CoA kinase n=1 Tax=Rubritalea marina TaxID=361055 RepID=UPI0003738537|nr:dephospho-CoA kinase [Rubritalea marina]